MIVYMIRVQIPQVLRFMISWEHNTSTTLTRDIMSIYHAWYMALYQAWQWLWYHICNKIWYHGDTIINERYHDTMMNMIIISDISCDIIAVHMLYNMYHTRNHVTTNPLLRFAQRYSRPVTWYSIMMISYHHIYDTCIRITEDSDIFMIIYMIRLQIPLGWWIMISWNMIPVQLLM